MVLFILTGAIALWLAGGFVFDLHRYFQLSEEKSVHLDQWKMIEEEGNYSIAVNYSFEWKGQEIQGRYYFPRPVYQNPYITEEHMNTWKEREWKIYFNPKHPTEASLQKKFPARKGINLGLSLGILLYFLLLKGYISRTGHLDQRSS